MARTFIIPSSPVLKSSPPSGDEWLHEVKFDGWRLQLHKEDDSVALFGRRNSDLTKRFRTIHDAVIALPCGQRLSMLKLSSVTATANPISAP